LTSGTAINLTSNEIGWRGVVSVAALAAILAAFSPDRRSLACLRCGVDGGEAGV
jgi:hypothetical protein